MWAVESLKICILRGPFCPKHIKFQMKRYRSVTSHDTEEWCNVWKKTDSWFQKWHGNLVNLNASSGKSENLYFDKLLSSKVYYVWAKKKYRRVMCHNTEE